MRSRSYLFLILILAMALGAQASPDSFVYQGRIVKPDGNPLEYNNVSFAFTITNAAGNCVFYREQKDSVNMQGSGGVFDVPIGSGTRLFPTSAGANIRDAFINSVALACEGGGTYTPSENEVRLLKVQFHDGAGWNAITPNSTIRSVPFATFSYSAGRLGNNLPGDFVLKNSLATCQTGQYLTYDGTNFSCQNDSGGTGTLSDVNVTSPLTKGGTASIPTIGISVGTTAGTVAAGNDTRFSNALKIQGVAVDSTAPTLGQVLRYDGASSWVPTTLAISDISNLSTQLANKINATMFPTSCTAGQSLVFVTPANKFDCYDISITESQISGSISFSKLSGLPTTLAGYGITDAVKNLGGTPGFKSGMNASKGAAGTTGNIYISTDTKEIYRDNGATWDIIGSAAGSGGTITSVVAGTGITGGGTSGAVTVGVDVGTAANKIVQLDASAKLPAVDGSALTNLDPTKLSAVVPITKGGTGQSTATAGFNALSPVTTKGDLITRDGTNNIRLPAGTNGQVLSADSTQTAGLKWITPNAGTVTNVTATAPLSVSNGLTTPALSIAAGSANAQVLRWNTTDWTASYFNFADLKSAAGLQQIPSTCTTSQTLIWQSASDTFACTSISVSGSNFASQSANLVFAGPTSGSAAPSFRALTQADLPSGSISGSGTSGYVPYYNAASTLTNSPVYTNGTNVGVGTTNPLTKLQVVGKGLFGDTTSTSSGGSVLMLYTGNTANANSGLDVVTAATATPQTPIAQFSFRIKSDAGGNYRGALGFVNSSTPTETMTFLNTGYIGINTTAPTSPLEINKATSGVALNMDGPSNGWIAEAYNVGGVQKAIVGVSSGVNTYLSSSGEANGDFVVRGAVGNLLLASGSNETMRLTQTGYVGIGTTNPTTMLSVKGNALFGDKTTFPSDFNTIETNTYTNSLYNNTATSGTFGSFGSWMRVTPTADSTLASQAVSAGLSFNVPSGTTVTSNSDAMWVSAARNRYSSNTDNGTVTSIRGITVGYGHENSVPANTPITTNAYGIVINPSVSTGTITNMYDLYLGTKSSGGTVTNRYGIYQTDSGAKNYFNGSIGVGTPTPTFPLQVKADDQDYTLTLENYSNTTGSRATALLFRRALGTGASPSAVTSGTVLGGSYFTGYHSGGSFSVSTAAVRAVASENFTATAQGTDLYFRTTAIGTSTPVEQMTIKGNGYVGIGTIVPSYTLHVNGSVAGTSAYNNLSDIRLKKEIHTIPDALIKLESLRGVEYKWNHEFHPELNLGDRQELGVIAQEVEEVFPQAVSEDKHTGIKSVAYSMLIGPIIEAIKKLHQEWSNDSNAIHIDIQKQNREIASLKEENARLKKNEQDREERLRRLEQRLNALENASKK